MFQLSRICTIRRPTSLAYPSKLNTLNEFAFCFLKLFLLVRASIVSGVLVVSFHTKRAVSLDVNFLQEITIQFNLTLRIW